MPNIQYIASLLPDPKGKTTTLVKDQNVYDIVRHVMSMHNECQNDYDLICEHFWKGNVESTAKYIFDFCKQNIPYSIEPAKAQTVKSPATILRDAMDGDINQDCKHYALFCNGIIHALQRKGYPISCKYRFASDVPGELYPKHVFSIIPVNDGYIWLDPVLPNFNQFHKYYYFKDKVPKMALYKVSGVQHLPNQQYNDYISGWCGEEMGAHGRGRAKVNRAIKHTFDATKKIALSPNRNAFLALVKINFLNIASKLHKKQSTPQGARELHNFWVKVGGNPNKLQTAISQGIKHHVGKKIHGFGENDSIGMPQIAVILAEAAPIFAALAPLLKALGVSTQQVDEITKAAAAGKDITNALETIPDKLEPDNITMLPAGPGKKVIPGEPTMMDYDNENEADRGVVKAAKNTELIKASREEIPEAKTGIEETANVVTDWGKGFRDFIQNNRGTVITLGSITLGVVAVKYIFSKTTKRKR